MAAGFVAAALAVLWFVADPAGLLGWGSLTPADRRALERGEIISRTLDGTAGQVGVLAVSRINTGTDALINTARAIEDLKRSAFVLGIRRFSDPPRLEDLDPLVLPPKELQAAIACRRNACSLKLAPEEIDLLVEESTRVTPDRDARVQAAFRRAVLLRVTAYLASGVRDLAPLVNRTSTPGTESFLYWSQESYGAGKPVVLVTHVNIVPPSGPDEPAVVIGKQVFANHYMNDALAVTAIATDAATGARFLIYRNNTSVDLLSGFLGPIRRAVLESRLRRDVPGIIQKLRTRLEQQDRSTR